MTWKRFRSLKRTEINWEAFLLKSRENKFYFSSYHSKWHNLFDVIKTHSGKKQMLSSGLLFCTMAHSSLEFLDLEAWGKGLLQLLGLLLVFDHKCVQESWATDLKIEDRLKNELFKYFMLVYTGWLLGLIHTRHFDGQYCDKKRISSHMFQWPTKVSSEKTYLDFLKEFTLAYRDPWPKNVFLSQYCVQKCLVRIRP